MKELFSRKNLVTLILMGITAIGVTVTTILSGQSFLRIFPIYISLFIGLLQTKVNRYAPLLGGFNSISYAAIYFYYGLYGSAFYALLFSCPLQLITFLRWTKHKQGSTTLLRRMTWKQRLYTLLAYCVACVGMILVLKLLDSNYALLDTTASLLGILTTLLSVFAFIEYTVLQLVGCFLSITLYITMLANGDLEQLPYLVYILYALFCSCLSVPNARKLYAQQQAENAKEA